MKTIRIKKAIRRSFFAFVTLSCLFTKAQTEISSPISKKLYGGLGHLNFSVEQINISNLNENLSSNGYGTIPLNNFSFGGGGVFVINSFIIGGGGGWLSETKTQNTANSLSFKGGHGYASLGYILFSGKHSLLYPILGIGGGGYTMIASRKDPQTDFSQQLNSPNTSINFETGGLILNLQLSYHYFFNRTATEGFFIGLKGGYKYSPTNWKITMNDKELNGSPSINMNGFFMSVILGGGSAVRQ